MKQILGLTFLFLVACATSSQRPGPSTPREPSSLTPAAACSALNRLEIHSHRGAWDRPENMLAAFLRAVDQGADYVEMDLQITQDDQIIVAHDAYMKRECRDAKNVPISDAIYYRKMPLAKIKTYDCGSVVPRGVPVPGERISTLAEVLAGLKDKISRRGLPIKFNIEIKYNPTQPEYYPAREYYVTRILEVIEKSGIDRARIMIQSFDIETLKVVRRHRPDLRLSPLLSEAQGGVQIAQMLKAELVTPHYGQVNPGMLAEFHKPTADHPQGIKVVPWTVNDPETAEKLLSWGVDGLITDNPEWYHFAKGFCAAD